MELVYNDKTPTLLQDALQKVLLGYTTIEEVYGVIDIEDALDSIFSYPKETTIIMKTVATKIENNKNTIKVEPAKESVKEVEQIIKDHNSKDTKKELDDVI